MTSLLLLGIILTALALLALMVLFKNYKNKTNLLFFFLLLFSILWFLFLYFADNVNIGLARILVSFDFTFAALMSSTLFLLFINFPKSKTSRIFDLFTYLTAVPFIVLSFTNFIVKDIYKAEGGIEYSLGVLFFPYIVYISTLILGGIFYLIKTFKASRGLEKKQVQYVLLGGAFSSVIMLTIAGILPRFAYIGPEITRLGIYSSLFFIGFTSYAIVKHRLMDIRMVVARSVAYSIVLAIMAGFYGAAIFAVQSLIFPQATYTFGYVAIQIILAVIMAFTFQPLRNWITKATDSFFFKNQYNSEQFLDSLAHSIGSTIVLVELIFKTLELIRAQIKVTRGIMVILTDGGNVYNSQSYGYKEALKISKEDMQKLAHDGILVADELDERSPYKRILKRYDAAIAIPLKTDNAPQGVLLLGEKLSGDMYSAKDLQVFEIMAPELAVAITNAKSYEKIEKFNITLRQEVKKAVAELEHKNEQLRELDKAKDEFISMASHQLRTPLTAIKGYLSMLLEGDAGEIKVSQYDFVNEAFQGANRMVGLINDLLNVSRMETGRFFLEPVEVDLDRLVQEEMKQLSNHAKEKKLCLKYEKKGKIPAIWADETKIRQVVMNFMDNAIYYTTKGEVTVKLHADKTSVIYEVSDSGIGVPKSQQKNLFTKFYRADNARHVRPDGTGLGIYLAKKVVDDHGGELIFHSVEGKGSTFGFKFPLNSKLKIKRMSAPLPSEKGTNPALGELAAGIGADARSLAATSLEPVEEIKQGVCLTGKDDKTVSDIQDDIVESLEASAEAKEKTAVKVKIKI